MKLHAWAAQRPQWLRLLPLLLAAASVGRGLCYGTEPKPLACCLSHFKASWWQLTAEEGVTVDVRSATAMTLAGMLAEAARPDDPLEPGENAVQFQRQTLVSCTG
jgi:hypothetical protein